MGKYRNRLKDLREDRDKTQAKIAEAFYLQVTQYRRYENGETDLPTEWAKKFAKYYNVSIYYIACLIDDPKPLANPTKKELTAKQLALLEAYEEKKEFQKTIDKLLDI